MMIVIAGLTATMMEIVAGAEAVVGAADDVCTVAKFAASASKKLT
jgi:hypothetical protein